MIIFVSCIGVIALFYIQFRLYKMEHNQGIKPFIKSKELWNVVKEFLIIVLGATIALNLTTYVEEMSTKKEVIALLEVAAHDIDREYEINKLFITLLEHPHPYSNIRHTILRKPQNTFYFEQVLSDKTVLATISPTIYNSLMNDVYNMNQFYEDLKKKSEDTISLSFIQILEAINSHLENIQWAINLEIEHLHGNCSEAEIQELRDAYFGSKYSLIENIE